MEKLIYLLWKPDTQSIADFRKHCSTTLASAIAKAGATRIRFMIADEDVAPAQAARIISQNPAFDAVLSFWVDSAVAAPEFNVLIANAAARFSGFLVTESEPLRNQRFPTRAGSRTHGMNQVVLLQRPPRLARQEWLQIWQQSHTAIAIETQSSFGYRQNIVMHPVSEPLVQCDAIVEENFPVEAMTDREAFYNSTGNPILKAEREKRMIDSCLRFIDFDRIDCIPTSEYGLSD
jgi:hypothetical protein